MIPSPDRERSPAARAPARVGGSAALERDLLDHRRAHPGSPGVLAALAGDGWEWSGADGAADEGGRPLAVRATVRIASVTKTFTAAAVLRLVESSRLRLDDRVADLVSAELVEVLRAGGHRPADLSVRHLLQHTAGLYDWGSDPRYDRVAFADPTHRWSRLEQVRWAMEHGRPLASPGSEFHYSDTGYVLLGDVLERVTGGSLATAYRSLLDFERLGLDSVFLESLEPRPPGAEPLAHQYVGAVDLAAVDPSCDLWGGGGLVSSMRDLTGFVRALFGGEVFEHPETLQLMLEPIAARGAEGRGLGIFRLPLGSGTWWGHPGVWGVVMAYCPERRLAVATAMTRQPADPDVRYDIGRRLLVTAGGAAHPRALSAHSN